MNNIDKDTFHYALEEVILDIDGRLEKYTESIQSNVNTVEEKLDKLIDILERLL